MKRKIAMILAAVLVAGIALMPFAGSGRLYAAVDQADTVTDDAADQTDTVTDAAVDQADMVTDAAQTDTETDADQAEPQNIAVRYPELPKQAADDFEDVIGITVPALALDGSVYEWEYPYTDEFFSVSPEEFSVEMSRGSLGLAMSAFRNDDTELANQYETYLTAAGFTDITPFGYDEPTSKDSLSGVVAYKKVGDTIVIAAVPCGQGYKNEWAGNFYVGDEERHVGFNNAAMILEGKIRDFIEAHQFTGPMKLWTTGFSRASAVANLTAADMIESGLFEDVYAYLFAVPRTTRNPVAYEGIYNICGKFDPVPVIPWQTWGYERYGIDLYTPAQETESDYFEKVIGATFVKSEFSESGFRNNPEINYQLHMILQFMTELFPTSADYVAEFQEAMINAMVDHSGDSFVEAIAVALNQMDNLDARQEYSSEIFMDYIYYVLGVHLKGNTRQIEDGSWDPDAKISENLMYEHLPSTYLSWIFSDDNIENLYHGALNTRRLIISGNVDISVYDGDTIVGSIDRNGNLKDLTTQLNQYAKMVLDYYDNTLGIMDPDEAKRILEQNPDGAGGTDGNDGTDGIGGVDGTDGTDGTGGADGVDGVDGADGADGVDGVDGADGTDAGAGTEPPEDIDIDALNIPGLEEFETINYSGTVLFLMRTGDETILTIPMDREYTVRITVPERQTLYYHNVVFSTDSMDSSDNILYINLMEEGEYVLQLDTTGSLPELEPVNGKIVSSVKEEFSYSLLSAMVEESSTTSHLTLADVIGSTFLILLGLVILIIVCLIIFIVHAIRRLRGHKPFSPLYVIIPHILLIGLFAILTQFFMLNFVSIGQIKTVCAALTGFFIFLLALRGFLRNRKLWTGIYAALMLVITVLTFLLFAKSPLAVYSTTNMILIFALAVVFTAVAVAAFYIGRNKTRRA